MISKSSWITRRPWRPDSRRFPFNVLLLTMVSLAAAVTVQANEGKPDLVVVTSPAEDGVRWALCLRQEQDGKPAGACYSSAVVSSQGVDSDAGENTVGFADSWASWLQAIDGRKARPMASTEAPHGALEIFEVPRQRSQTEGQDLFLQQVQLLVAGTTTSDLETKAEALGKLVTVEELRSRAERRSDRLTKMAEELGRARAEEPDPVDTVFQKVFWAALMLFVALLPSAAALTSIRLRTGGIPAISDFRDAVKNRQLVDQCNRRLDEWMNEASEQEREYACEQVCKDSSMNPLLAKLNIALERLHGLRKDLTRILGYKVGLTNLYSDLTGRIARLGRPGKPATLETIFTEVINLRKVQDALQKHEARRTTDNEDVEAWIERIVERLDVGQKTCNELRKMGVSNDTDLLADLKLLCDSARKFTSQGSQPIAELPSVLNGVRRKLDGLVNKAGVGVSGSAEVQIEAIVEKWSEDAEKAARLVTEFNEKQKELEQQIKLLQGIAHALFPESRHSLDPRLVENTVQLAESHRAAESSLKPWSGESDVGSMATKIVGQLTSLEREFFPQTGGDGARLWHERFREKLQGSQLLTTKLESIERIASSYLGLKPGHHLEETLQRESQRPHRALRLRILSALEQGGHTARSPQEEKIAEVLRLGEIQEKARDFLARLGALPDALSLWNTGIASCFSDQWLHNLFRAALVLETYYWNTDILDRFRWVCTLADGFQQSLKELGKPCASVRLLTPPERSWQVVNKTSKLVGLSNVWQKVRERRGRGEGFVVDIERFALPGVQHFEECRIILFNPADWDPSQERQS